MHLNGKRTQGLGCNRGRFFFIFVYHGYKIGVFQIKKPLRPVAKPSTQGFEVWSIIKCPNDFIYYSHQEMSARYFFSYTSHRNTASLSSLHAYLNRIFLAIRFTTFTGNTSKSECPAREI